MKAGGQILQREPFATPIPPPPPHMKAFPTKLPSVLAPPLALGVCVRGACACLRDGFGMREGDRWHSQLYVFLIEGKQHE